MELEQNLNDIINPLIKSLIFKKNIAEADLVTVLNITIQKLLATVNAQAITLFLLGKDDKIHFSYVYYSPSLYTGNKALEEKFRQKTEELKKLTLEKGIGIVGKVMSTTESYLSNDVTKDPNFFGGTDEQTGFVTKTMITVPLIADKSIGAIQVLNRVAGNGTITAFSDDDRYFLEDVASYSSKVIQKAYFPEIEFTEKELASYVAKITKHPCIELDDDFEADKDLMELIGPETLRKYPVLPLSRLGNIKSKELRVILGNPLDYNFVQEWEIKSGFRAKEIVVAATSDIKRIIDKYLTSVGEAPQGQMDEALAKLDDYSSSESSTIEIDDKVDESSAPIIQLANKVIEEAFTKGVSDIHIEPQEYETVIRYRIDGSLQKALIIPKKATGPLTARYKIMSDLNITERRIPQDGRIKFKNFTKKNMDIELRVSIGPLVFGEKIVMRILDKSGTMLGLDKMGFSEGNLKLYRNCIVKPYGMILHVGPTGSGKTTTLYAALNEVNTEDVNIQTAEDPVEYMIKGINQMQMNKQVGLTFGAALRCFLRQDPDIVMVGEIRDLETGEIAIEAALTGHLVVSTLHTNDAPTTVTRFIDMGIEPFLISSSLLCVCAQRLLRRLCPKCKEQYQLTPEEYESLQIPPGTGFYKKVGCAKCNSTGYKGRIGVHEILTLNDELKALINQKKSAEVIKEAAVRNGMVPLYNDGMQKAINGITTIDEVFSNLREE